MQSDGDSEKPITDFERIGHLVNLFRTADNFTCVTLKGAILSIDELTIKEIADRLDASRAIPVEERPPKDNHWYLIPSEKEPYWCLGLWRDNSWYTEEWGDDAARQVSHYHELPPPIMDGTEL